MTKYLMNIFIFVTNNHIYFPLELFKQIEISHNHSKMSHSPH